VSSSSLTPDPSLDAPLLAVLARAQDLGFLGPGPVDRHVRHAEAFVAAVDAAPLSLLDLGAGGGIPGLVLARRWPETAVVLLDAQERRTTFLVAAVRELCLERVSVVSGRAEAVAHDPSHRGRYEVVTARSFGPPAVTAECGAPFVCPDGTLVVAEPPGAPASRWPATGLARLGLEDGGVARAGGGTVRRLRRVGAVEKRLPRRIGVPAKRPLF
jgi:16S rRNA (guanine527-N7)-methyltransferase